MSPLTFVVTSDRYDVAEAAKAERAALVQVLTVAGVCASTGGARHNNVTRSTMAPLVLPVEAY